MNGSLLEGGGAQTRAHVYDSLMKVKAGTWRCSGNGGSLAVMVCYQLRGCAGNSTVCGGSF